jgi:hypothetical protein
MTPEAGRRAIPAGRRAAAITAAAVLLGRLGLAGCGLGEAVSAVQKAAHDASANKGTIDQFTAGLKGGKTTPFQAVYKTTGASPTTATYAVRPPAELAFRESPRAGRSPGNVTIDLIVTASGEYACSPPAPAGGRGACDKLGKARAAVQNKIPDLYPPAHWVTFLKEFSLAAGFAGDKVARRT